MERDDIYQLCQQKSSHRANDDQQALSENSAKGSLHIGYPLPCILPYPPAGRRQLYGQKDHHEGVYNQPHRQEGQHANAPFAVVLIDDVGHHKHDWPEQHARRKLQRTRLTKKLQIKRLPAESIFEGKNLDANEFGYQRVGYEKAAQNEKQKAGLMALNITRRPFRKQQPNLRGCCGCLCTLGGALLG